MAKLSIGDKARRVLDFNLGMRNARVRRALAAYGFGDADLDEGWRLLSQLTAHKLDYQPNLLDPRLLGQLDEWENRWFPIAEVVLRMHHPEAHAIVFLNLAQTSGAEVLVSVRTFLDRLDAIAKPRNEGGLGPEGRAARKLLQKRGLDEGTIDEARALLAQIGAAEEPAPEPDPGDAGVEAEENLWKWYLEWSAIARVAIRDRRLLRSLGFLRTVRKASGEEIDEVVTEEELDTDEPTPVTDVLDPSPPEPEPIEA